MQLDGTPSKKYQDRRGSYKETGIEMVTLCGPGQDRLLKPSRTFENSGSPLYANPKITAISPFARDHSLITILLEMAIDSALVTGCSAGGIGAAVALALAKRGVHVFATARNTTKIAPELSSHSNVTVLALDVLSDASVAETARTVGNSGRGLDVLVNNAGSGYAQPVLDIDIEKAKKLYDVNVWGPIRTIQAFAGLLIERRGRIVNVSTVGSIVHTPWIGMSCLCMWSGYLLD